MLALVGSTILTFAVILGVAFLERRGRGLGEGRIGMLCAIAGAVTILLLASDRVTEIGVLGLLKGEIIAIPDTELRILVLGYGAILALVTIFHKELVRVAVDREMAIWLGKRVALWDLVLFGISGVAISLGVLVVGPLVMFGFLIVPPIMAGRLAIGMRNVAIVAAVVGAGIALVGFAAAYRLDSPTRATRVALGGAVLAFVVSLQALGALVVRAA